jgi:hypothetical protein
MNGGGVDGDGISYGGVVRRRLVSSSPSLSSSALHHLFLVRLAGGKVGVVAQWVVVPWWAVVARLRVGHWLLVRWLAAAGRLQWWRMDIVGDGDDVWG